MSKKLPISRHQQAEFKRNVWRVTAEPGTTREDMAKPEFWSHIGSKMQSFDKIEVVPEEGGWYAEFLVVKAGRLFANVKELVFVTLGEAVPAKDADITDTSNPDYDLKYKGPSDKWCVFRKADNEKVLSGFASKAEAQTALREYVKKAA